MKQLINLSVKLC